MIFMIHFLLASSNLTFTEQLREDAGPNWTAVIAHRFTDEIAAGTISPSVLKRYLVQDHKFVDTFVVLLASMIAAAPSLEDRVPGAQFLGLITSKENNYFVRSFEELGVTAADRAVPGSPVQAAFDMLMRNAAASGSLAQMLAMLVAAEWSYQTWGERVLPTAVAEPFWCREWVDLHSGEYFGSVVSYLRDLLDRIAPALSKSEHMVARATFACAVALEKAFFDQAYSERDLAAPKCIYTIQDLPLTEKKRGSWWRWIFGKKA
mmetsp:Transcript_52620/g.87374  ORF Transcript_52620/g.87374 Transcript_52620/m.87374 type:complete len:263 (-) Transcript_52620:135-923(-)